jgi:hypothetical protein
MLRKATFVTIFLFLCAGAALGQSVEITPTFGYVFGGDLDDVYSNFESGKLNLGDSEEYGISADFMTRDGWGVELLWMRQGTDLDGADDFFHDKANASMNVFHIGGIYQFRRGTTMQPFVVGTLGGTQLKAGGLTHNGFSYAGGGGVKFYFGNHFGARLQGSISNTHFGADDEIVCTDDVCYGLSDTNNVMQFHAQAGFIFKF